MPVIGLYNKRTHVADIVTHDNGMIKSVINVLNENLLPIMLKKSVDAEQVKAWMNTRKIPPERDGLKEVREMFPRRAVPHNMFSLSDPYWFRWNERETWEKGNFFTNRYYTDYGRMFFTPWTVKKENILYECPDMTTGGVCRKRWMQEEDGLESYLIKMGWGNAHQHPLAEAIASIILQSINIIDSVRYTLVVDGLTICSKCKNFVTEDTEFVPAAHVYHFVDREDKETVYEHLLNMMDMFGIKFGKKMINRLVVADAIIKNNDRNLNNFGFLRSVETGEIIGMAPLFDSGSAFFGGPENNKLFDEKTTSEIVKKLARNIDFSDLIDIEELTETINDFPILEQSERERIINELKANLERIGKESKNA